MNRANYIRYVYDVNRAAEFILCSNSTISYPWHNHVSVLTIGIILDGSVILNVGDRLQVLGKNETFFIPPYMPHSMKANNEYTLLSLCIRKDLPGLYRGDMDKVKAGINKLLIATAIPEFIIQKQMIRLLSCLDSFDLNALHRKQRINDLYIGTLSRRLELFPESKISLDEMAYAALTSKYHFIRSFKQEIGLTPHQFQLQNRIRKAQRMINNTDTLTEVALTAGFCDQSHFIKQFEKYVGLTPTAYKMSSNELITDFAV